MTDRSRQLLVTAGAVVMIAGTLFGFGLIGTRVEETAGGSFAADATLLSPATRAFSIWSVIYLGLIAYVVWQWLPANTRSPRARRIGWLSALSMALNGAWLLVTQAGALWLSVVVIAMLALTVGQLVRVLGEPRTLTERIVLDGTFGLYLGWVAVATLANVTAVLVASGIDPRPEIAEYWAVAVLALGAGLGVVLARVLGGSDLRHHLGLSADGRFVTTGIGVCLDGRFDKIAGIAGEAAPAAFSSANPGGRLRRYRRRGLRSRTSLIDPGRRVATAG